MADDRTPYTHHEEQTVPAAGAATVEKADKALVFEKPELKVIGPVKQVTTFPTFEPMAGD